MKKATEDRLMRAVEATANHVNDGLSPTAAVIKAARDHQLPPGGVTKLVHAFNTARTTRQRVDHTDIYQKTATVELADAAQALEAIYPETVKTAAEVRRDSVLSTDYATSPKSFLRDRERTKLAAQPLAPLVTEKPKPYKADQSHAIKMAYGERDRCIRETEEARRLKSAAMDKMSSTFCSLTQLCMRSSAHPLDVIRRNVLAMHGEKAAQVVDQLAVVTPSLTKMSHHRTSGATWDRCSREPAVGPIYEKIATMLEQIKAFQTAEANYETVKTANEARSAVALAPFVQRPGGDGSLWDLPSPAPSPPTGSPMPSSAAGLDKSAMPSVWQTLGSVALAKGLFDGVAKDMKAPDSDSMINKTLNKLTDPEHEGKLRAINTQATLQDFMLNDPVISGHNPDDVIDAFNEITQLAPSISDQRAPLQAMLRKKLQQGSLDTFDVDQALKLEQGLRQRNLMPRPLGALPGAN